MSSSPYFQMNSPFIDASATGLFVDISDWSAATVGKFNTREVIHGKFGLNEGLRTKNFPKTNCFDASKMISETHGSIFDRR